MLHTRKCFWRKWEQFQGNWKKRNSQKCAFIGKRKHFLVRNCGKQEQVTTTSIIYKSMYRRKCKYVIMRVNMLCILCFSHNFLVVVCFMQFVGWLYACTNLKIILCFQSTSMCLWWNQRKAAKKPFALVNLTYVQFAENLLTHHLMTPFHCFLFICSFSAVFC